MDDVKPNNELFAWVVKVCASVKWYLQLIFFYFVVVLQGAAVVSENVFPKLYEKFVMPSILRSPNPTIRSVILSLLDNMSRKPNMLSKIGKKNLYFQKEITAGIICHPGASECIIF